jgi:uncharacterized membrane protein YheB (UPF0754 family)
MQASLSFVRKLLVSKRSIIVGLIVAGIVAAIGGGALASRSAGDHFADAAFGKLGGDSTQVLDKIADKVVEKLTGKGGTLDEAQAQLVAQLATMAGKKLGKVDPNKLIDDVRSQVVSAGLGKLDGISVDDIVHQVTAALITQASGKLDGVDVNKLAKDALADVVKSLDLDKLVKAKIDSLDVEAIVNKAIAKQMSGGKMNVSLLSLFGR